MKITALSAPWRLTLVDKVYRSFGLHRRRPASSLNGLKAKWPGLRDAHAKRFPHCGRRRINCRRYQLRDHGRALGNLGAALFRFAKPSQTQHG
ncbi:MAG TPA: hypothetical protein VIY68_02510 [Steroidobacteraceae bacterium]